MPTTAYTYDARFLLHDAGVDDIRLPSGVVLDPEPNPSSRRVTRRTAQLIANSGLLEMLTEVPAWAATHEDLSLFHDPRYVDEVHRLATTEGGMLGDIYVTRATWDAAVLAAGTAIALARAVVDRRHGSAYGLLRPGGHLATAAGPLGSDIFNNIAIAARSARARGVGRIAVVNWDVHHGKGTQDAFWDDPDTLLVDLHQDRWFPRDTGAAEEVGGGGALGTTVNIPLPAGTGDRGYAEAFDRIVVPILDQFAPELIVVAAGQDGSLRDPLGRMMLSRDGYHAMAAAVRRVADRACEGCVVALDEGGYAPGYTPFCTLAVVEGLVGARTDVPDPLEGLPQLEAARTDLQPVQREAIAAVRDVLTRWWDLP